MAELTWGKPTLEACKLVNGEIPTTPVWIKLPTQKTGTVKLTIEKGEKKEATGEGGEIVDVRYSKNKYSLECELFVKKGDVAPIEDIDGIILDQYAIRLTPEDESLTGYLMEKTTVSVDGTWSSEEGMLTKYGFSALQPATGKILKPYTKEVAHPEPAE